MSLVRTKAERFLLIGWSFTATGDQTGLTQDLCQRHLRKLSHASQNDLVSKVASINSSL